MHVTVILGWPKSLFGFSAGYYEKTQMNFLANPICDKGEILLQLQVNFFFFLKKIICLFIYFYGCTGFSLQLQVSLVDCSQRGLFFAEVHDFSLWWLLFLQSTGARHMGFSSCDAGASAQAQWFWHMGLVATWHVVSSWTRDLINEMKENKVGFCSSLTLYLQINSRSIKSLNVKNKTKILNLGKYMHSLQNSNTF